MNRFEISGLKTQNVEKLSIDNFCQNIKRLRIHSKPTEFTHNRTEIDKNFQCALVNGYPWNLTCFHKIG